MGKRSGKKRGWRPPRPPLSVRIAARAQADAVAPAEPSTTVFSKPVALRAEEKVDEHDLCSDKLEPSTSAECDETHEEARIEAHKESLEPASSEALSQASAEAVKNPYEEACKEAYKHGYEDGYKEGYKEAYKKAYKKAYQEAYKQAYKEARKNAS